jgi:excisionase family DNA binding protein
MPTQDHPAPSKRPAYLTVEAFIAKNRQEGRPLVGRTATYDALRRGELPHIRLGRKILIPEDAFDRMLEAANPGSPEQSAA